MYGKFLVEGDKTVRELLRSSFKIDAIYALPDWQADHSDVRVETISAGELAQLSTHDSPNQVVAVACIPDAEQPILSSGELYIACDQINDPGNAGTIIRIADWFGISTVIFSSDSVEVYNPKVVSSAKGSLFRTRIIYTDLADLLQAHPILPVIGAVMDGDNLYKTALPSSGILMIGNEANGISPSILPYITRRISIPAFGAAESLNAAVATGVIVGEWRRQIVS